MKTLVLIDVAPMFSDFTRASAAALRGGDFNVYSTFVDEKGLRLRRSNGELADANRIAFSADAILLNHEARLVSGRQGRARFALLPHSLTLPFREEPDTLGERFREIDYFFAPSPSYEGWLMRSLAKTKAQWRAQGDAAGDRPRYVIRGGYMKFEQARKVNTGVAAREVLIAPCESSDWGLTGPDAHWLFQVLDWLLPEQPDLFVTVRPHPSTVIYSSQVITRLKSYEHFANFFLDLSPTPHPSCYSRPVVFVTDFSGMATAYAAVSGRSPVIVGWGYQWSHQPVDTRDLLRIGLEAPDLAAFRRQVERITATPGGIPVDPAALAEVVYLDANTRERFLHDVALVAAGTPGPEWSVVE